MTLRKAGVNVPKSMIDRLPTPFVVVGLVVALVRVPVLNDVAALELVAEEVPAIVEEPG